MIRLLIRLLLSLLANAIGIVAANILLDGFSVTISGLLLATALFTVATTILGPLVTKIAFTHASYLMGGIALVTTLVGLVITTLLTTDLQINGLTTWIAATVIIWLFSVTANVILPLVLFKKILAKPNDSAQK